MIEVAFRLEGRTERGGLSIARWHVTCAAIQVLCLLLDKAAGPDVLAAGAAVRLCVVVPSYLAGAWLVEKGPYQLRSWGVLAPILLATIAVTGLGAMAPSPFDDRYTMAAGLIPFLSIILIPITLPEAKILALIAVPFYAAIALVPWGFKSSGQVADLVVFMSGLIILGLVVRHRIALTEAANQQLLRLDQERTEQLAELAQKFEELSNTDPLTGVANRRAFDRTADALFKECARKTVPLGLLMIDVDHFKSFNDVAGHMAGDQCLRALTTFLSAECDADHCQLFRYGGEEFSVLLPGSPPEQTHRVAERLRSAAVAAAVPHPGLNSALVTVSIGAATAMPHRTANMNELIAAADSVLYAAKAAGRDRVMALHLHAAMEMSSREESALKAA